jgi:F-type H+-transporting ATPase subunit c
MTAGAILAFSLPMSLAVAALGSAVALGRVVGAAVEATARQPEASGKIMVNMMAGAALIEALTIYVLILVFMLIGKIP